MPNDNQWHLSKSVPISIIGGFILQFIGAVWWASGLDARVIQLEKSVGLNTVELNDQDDTLHKLETDVAVIKLNSDLQKEALRQLVEDTKTLLERTSSGR